MNPQQGIMSLTKPKQRVSARDSRAVDQVLDNTTQMLGKLDKKTLGLLLQLTQYLKANKPKYKELMANLEAKGSLPPGVFPDQYDPKFLSVFALSVAKAQQAKGGMAAGGIAGIAQTMKNQGRGKDTMLAHISPEEAELLEKRGGVGTTNPVTGLPEYGIFEDIGNALSGVGNAVGSVLKPVGDLIGSVVSSPLGMAAAAAAAYYFMGPSAGAILPGVAEAAIPGEVAGIGTAAHLTPAAIESGIGSAGYGFNASAASSGLFDPSVIGSGAAIGAPSTTDKLLSTNLLKNVKLSSGEEEPASDPNALIKMLMMFEMMNNKQSQPTNAVVPMLAENTSTLPYDTPKKPAYPQTRAAEGGLMTKHLGIGGLSANRTQTDYAKNYLPGSKYRPGQGGVTYFTPMKYGAGPVTPVEPTPTPTPVDELVNQTIGRPGGGGGGGGNREPVDPNSFSAQWAAMNDAEKEAYRLEHPMIAAAQDLAMLVGAPLMWAYNKIQEIMGPDSSKGGPARYARVPVTPDVAPSEVGGYEPGSQEAKAAAAGTVGGYGPGTPGFNLGAAPGTPNEIAGYDMQRALDLAYPKTNEMDSVYAQIEAADAAERAEKAQIAAAEEKSYAERLSRDTLKRELQKSITLVNADPNALEGDSGLALMDKMSTLKDQINKLDSPYSDRFAPVAVPEMYAAEAIADAINNLEPGDRFAPVNFSNQYLSPEAYQAEVDKLNATDESKAPETEKERLDQIIQSFLDATSGDTSVLGPAVQLAALGDYSLGEDGTDTIGNYSMFTPNEATETPGLLSTAAIQQAFPGAFNQSPLASLAPTSYGYLGSQGSNSILGGYGGEGSSWQGVTDRYGNPVLTMQGAAEKAFLSSPEGIQAANTEADKTYSPPQGDPAQQQAAQQAAMERAVAESNAAADRTYGRSADTGPANDGRSDPGGEGGTSYGRVAPGYGGGSEAATGGLSTPYGFQHMAHGGIAALHQYNLGSYSDGGRLLKGPGNGTSDDIPAIIGHNQPARLAEGEFVLPARIVSEIGNGSTDAGARELYKMMDRIQQGRAKTVGKNKVAFDAKTRNKLPA